MDTTPLYIAAGAVATGVMASGGNTTGAAITGGLTCLALAVYVVSLVIKARAHARGRKISNDHRGALGPDRGQV